MSESEILKTVIRAAIYKITHGKYGIWLGCLGGWARTSEGTPYRYDDLEMAKYHADLFWRTHEPLIREFN